MSKHQKNLIETEAIIVAYAMSRLDTNFLSRFSFKSWKEAFNATGKRFEIPPASMKNLRDEFDPIHSNSRKGWHQRPLRTNRQRVLGEFCDCSDDALIEIVIRLLERDKEVLELIVEPLAKSTSRVGNVGERLRTGHLAEEYFMQHSEQICGVPGSALLDHRLMAQGYDFGVQYQRVLIEIKGIKKSKGDILFSDLEWQVAKEKGPEYWLVVVGLIEPDARTALIKGPAKIIEVTSSIQKRTIVSWRSTVEVSA